MAISPSHRGWQTGATHRSPRFGLMGSQPSEHGRCQDSARVGADRVGSDRVPVGRQRENRALRSVVPTAAGCAPALWVRERAQRPVAAHSLPPRSHRMAIPGVARSILPARPPVRESARSPPMHCAPWSALRPSGSAIGALPASGRPRQSPIPDRHQWLEAAGPESPARCTAPVRSNGVRVVAGHCASGRSERCATVQRSRRARRDSRPFAHWFYEFDVPPPSFGERCRTSPKPSDRIAARGPRRARGQSAQPNAHKEYDHEPQISA